MGRSEDNEDDLRAAVAGLQAQMEQLRAAVLPRQGSTGAQRRQSPHVPLGSLEAIYSRRRVRDAVFADHADLFGEPAWDILLDAAIMQQKGKPHLVGAACVGPGAPMTTALRYISVLEERGLLQSERDVNDGRRRYLKLSDKGWALLKRYLASVNDEDSALSQV